MTATAAANRSESDAQLLTEIGKAFFGRELASGGVVWQREMSRAIGIPLSQLQALATDRPLTAKSKKQLSAWATKARKEERQKNVKRLVLLKELDGRVA